jgi:hypothetical protein
MWFIKPEYMENIFLNIVGGFLASILSLVVFWSCKRIAEFYRHRSFKKVFGKDAENDFNIVYGKMVLKQLFDEKGKPEKWPYAKSGSGDSFNISAPVSFTATKSAKYLAEAFSKDIKASPKLISDDEIRERLDLSYCALGGTNNHKTNDILESEENIFFAFAGDPLGIIVKKEPQKKYTIDGSHDFAFIIKVVPKSFPDRTWIALAGLGEWGTSGAAWFLAKKWRKIKNIAKNKEFGLIIKVKGGKDESAQIIYQYVKE